MKKEPVYWKTTLEDVEKAVKEMTLGRVEKKFLSAGQRPLYLISYGKANKLTRTANLSSALGAGDKMCYADKSKPDYRPTVLFAGCIHGGEFEGTAALLNLIKILETGTDYNGVRNELLSKAAEKVNILIIPCLNPDGRSRIEFSSMVGKTFEQLRYYNQGTWKDGSLCGWPDCKKIHPIIDYCQFLGAYFNDDGINIMHDDFFGKKSSETEFLFDAVEDFVPDFTVLLHGGAEAPNHILKPAYAPDAVKKNILALENALKSRCEKEKLEYIVTSMDRGENNHSPISFNLTSALYHFCGEPCVTYESNQGLEGCRCSLNHEQIYREHILLFEETIKHISEKEGK